MKTWWWVQVVIQRFWNGMDDLLMESTFLGEVIMVLERIACFLPGAILYTYAPNKLLVWLNMAYVTSHKNSIYPVDSI
ncbi:hypothetical protein BCR42DRAFT_413167 [Absidia repens]|uniref:Uncharacterized protein n=1 Tax=Absidia repens TaxID=90262 RepID=A0A1X2IKN4_9FUNG|nr:hypothetical protein BCR42DRAFT_413167 [Absidia repens]